MSPVPADYVDVAERIRQFKEQYPEGTLQSRGEPQLFHIGDRTFIAYCAAAYRTPDDPCPGIGWAWEPVPGPTPFTRDSELQNAETSAWGRAIVALGFETKHIASSNEVRNRQGGSQPVQETSQPSADEKPATDGQREEIRLAIKLLQDSYPDAAGPDKTWTNVAWAYAGEKLGVVNNQLTFKTANELREWLEETHRQLKLENQVPFGSEEAA